jgi:hypothetical protein
MARAKKTAPVVDEPSGLDGLSAYTVTTERDYAEVAKAIGFPNHYELAGFNGVTNSNYNVEPDQVIRIPQRQVPEQSEAVLAALAAEAEATTTEPAAAPKSD